MNRRCLRVVYKVFSIVAIVTMLVGLVPTPGKPPLPDLTAPLSSTPVLAQDVDASETPETTSSIEFKPSADARLDSPDGKVSVLVPAGASDEDLRIEYKQFTPPDSEGMRFLKTFDLKAYAVKRGDAVVSQFKKDLTITLKHDEDELRGIDLASLRLYYLDEQTRQWVPQNSRYDAVSRTLTVTTNHFTQEGEIGASLQSKPGLVMAFLTDMHSGTAVSSYPIEVPDGPGGFKPRIAPAYSSGVADEMKDKRATGSWVGIGWTLHMDRVSYDLNKNKYFLEFNGGSYELKYHARESAYYTIPDQFYKLVQNGNTWDMWDRGGVHYRFGYNEDSRQYYWDGAMQKYYRWDVDLIEDTHLDAQQNHVNQITISYQQDILSRDGHNNVRSAYPLDVNYNGGLVNIHFNSSFDSTDPTDGNLRDDNPKTQGANKAPVMMENKKLNSIEIKVGSPSPTTLVRKYVFDYTTTPSQLSTDYEGIYYSGIHKLNWIKEYGSDGASALPQMSFTYLDLQIGYNDTVYLPYSGNPGNPASLTWPHLQTVNSGYGGSVTYEYTQKPASGTANVWTRETVTKRTVNPGISGGVNQSYDYTYGADPEYYGGGWYGQYRGFRQATETDDSDAYSVHSYYTTGTIEGKDAEKLTGKEYKVERRAAGGGLLGQTQSTWDWEYTNDNDYYLWYRIMYANSVDQGVATDSAGVIYVASFNQSRILKYASNSNYLGYMALSYQPHDVAVDSAGYRYIVTSWHNVLKYDSNGQYVTSWGTQGSDDGQFNDPHGIAVDSVNNYVYVADTGNNRVQKFTTAGAFVTKWGTQGSPDGQFQGPKGIDVSPEGAYVYVADTGNHRIQRFDGVGYFFASYGSYGSGSSQFSSPEAVASDADGNVYVADTGNSRIQKFWSGNMNDTVYTFSNETTPKGIAVQASDHNDLNVYVVYQTRYLKKFGKQIHTVLLNQLDETTGAKTKRTRYEYDDYGNNTAQYLDGDINDSTDDGRVERGFLANTTKWIINRPVLEIVYQGLSTQKSQTRYYYDGQAWNVQPTEGDVTKVRKFRGAYPDSIYSGSEYDQYGNLTAQIEPNNYDSSGNVIDSSNKTSFGYDTTYNTFMVNKTYPPIGGSSMSESWDYSNYYLTDANGLHKLTHDGVNGAPSRTTSYYDKHWRPNKVVQPGDSESSPTVKYDGYDTWGTAGQQYVQVQTRTSGSDYQWQKFFFDGVGRIVQTQARGETEGPNTYTMVTSKAFNNRGLADKDYVTQKVVVTIPGYQTPAGLFTTYVYDALGRVTSQTNADGTTVSHSYTDWNDTVTDPLSHKKVYYNDAFGRLVKVEELDASYAVYAATNYTYDVLGNLKTVVDAAGNATTVNYDLLSRKTSMVDPDMGTWYYKYDSNGNLASQVDAKAQAINMYYDALNRLKGKTYTTGVSDPPNYTRPADPGWYTVNYFYDAWDGVIQFGKGLLTGVNGSAYVDDYTYDARGRMIYEFRNLGDVYATSYTYDSSDRLVTVTYPTGEVVTQGYNDTGLPISLQSSGPKSIVDSASYNNLGQITGIAQITGALTTTFGYWGVDGGPSGGYYGKLWEIKSTQNGGAVRQHDKYTWDAAGNLTQRQNALSTNTAEGFTYDFLDRLNQSKYPVITFGNSGDSQTSSPQKAALDPQGNILVVDKGNHRVQKFTSAGVFLGWFGKGNQTTGWHSAGSGEYGVSGNLGGQFNNPTGIAVDSGGYVYVSDGTNARVQKFNPDLTFDSMFGSYGYGDNNFRYPTDVAVDSGGNIYVADALNYKVKKFSSSFVFQRYWNGVGVPYGLDVDSQDYIYVVGSLNTVQKYNGLGELQNTYQDGFFAPYDVDVDSSGNMWVADSGNNRIVELSSSGAHLNSWTSAGSGQSNFSGPYGVARGTLQAYVVDTGNNRVQAIEVVLLTQSYNEIGNITASNGASYSYGSKPHAVTGVGSTSYAYDANGNMTTRGSQTITWDVENRPASISGGATFYYDGDGNRYKKVENNETVVYVNRYYEKNVTTGVATSYYYLGGKLVALKEGSTYRLVGQDHLGSTTTILTDTGGASGGARYHAYGLTMSSEGPIPTDKKYTGQRLGGSDLYYYNARYYDPVIGRFISADTIVPDPTDPQALNRYSYVLNNPLRYTDPTGHLSPEELDAAGIQRDDVSGDIWATLRYAEVGDKVVIDGQEYYVYHEANETGEPGNVALMSTDGTFVDILDVMGKDSGVESARVFRWDDQSYISWIGKKPDVTGRWELQIFAHTEVNWGRVGQGMAGSIEVALGVDVLLVLIGTGAVATPEGYEGAQVFYWVVDNGLNRMSGGKIDLPDLPPLPSLFRFRLPI